MQPPSISLNFNLAKLLLFLIPNGYVPPFAEIQLKFRGFSRSRFVVPPFLD